MRVKISVRAECSPELTVLDERRARGQREDLRQEVAQRVVHRDRAVAACDADVHVQTEGVVAPHDVAQKLVVAAVVRRVDDALVLPAAPRMRADCAERDADLSREALHLRPPLAHRGSCLAELGTPPGADLDLGRDQLADEMRLDVGADGSPP